MNENDDSNSNPTVKYAELDPAGVLIGYEVGEEPEVMVDPVTEAVLFVEVPIDCDLEPEKYKYDPEEKTFVLNRSIYDPSDPFVPTAKALIAIRDSRLIDLPEETLLWLRRYE